MSVKADTHAVQKAARLRSLPPATPSALVKLQERLRGFISVPGMDDYGAASAGNPLYPSQPLAIVFCATETDVALALACAQAEGWPLRARSGRHSVCGFSGVDGGLTIDVSLMNHVAVDYGARTATVGSGANFGQLNAALDIYMLHVPGGTCDDVGIAGHMQGGGYGFTAREYGVNCDRVREVRVMLADGRIIRAGREHNKHLHWAVRGGTGGNFGVLLDVTYDLAELYDVWGFILQWPIDQAPQVLTALQEGFMRDGDAPDQLGYDPVLAHVKGDTGLEQVLVMLGMYHGSRDEGTKVIAPLQAIGKPTMPVDTVDTYATLNDGLLNYLLGPGPAGTFEAKRSGYLVRPLGEAGWTAVCDYYKTTPNEFNIAYIEPYGGQVSRIAPDDCAFVHRAVDMNVFIDSFWNKDWPTCHSPQLAWEWVNGFIDILEPYRDGSVYQNYPEKALADSYRTAYWGENFSTLLACKQQADPGGVFTYEQAVTPYPPGASAPPAAPPVRVPELEPEPYSLGR
jgi:FAD/FMN-containing dehydrogenase